MDNSLFLALECSPGHLDHLHGLHPFEDTVAAQHHEVLLPAQPELFYLRLGRYHTGDATESLQLRLYIAYRA